MTVAASGLWVERGRLLRSAEERANRLLGGDGLAVDDRDRAHGHGALARAGELAVRGGLDAAEQETQRMLDRACATRQRGEARPLRDDEAQDARVDRARRATREHHVGETIELLVVELVIGEGVERALRDLTVGVGEQREQLARSPRGPSSCEGRAPRTHAPAPRGPA